MRGCEVRMRLGFSFAGRKKGLFANSSAIVALEEGTECAVWEWVLVVESKAMTENENENKLCLGTEKMKENSQIRETCSDTMWKKLERKGWRNWKLLLLITNFWCAKLLQIISNYSLYIHKNRD